MNALQRGDAVVMRGDLGTLTVVGTVLRVARDGSWADVRWASTTASWTKRMPDASRLRRLPPAQTPAVAP